MLHIEIIDKRIKATQTISSPSVYLDHWALRAISESEQLASRFVKGLADQGGTLVISWLNVVEFSKVTDDVQRNKADGLLEKLALNVFWLNPDFFTVSDLELVPKARIANDPHSDLEFLEFFVTGRIGMTKGRPTLSAPPLFAVIHAAPNIANQYDDVADQIVSQLARLRREFDENSVVRSAVRSQPGRRSYPRGTRIMARALIGRFMKDKLLKLNRNNAVDLTHTVVSVSYCDYVLLDTQWATMVNETRRDLTRAGVQVPIAKVFSKKSNGVEAFLTELEGKNR